MRGVTLSLQTMLLAPRARYVCVAVCVAVCVVERVAVCVAVRVAVCVAVGEREGLHCLYYLCSSRQEQGMCVLQCVLQCV